MGLEWRLTHVSDPNNSDPNASLGGIMSSVELSSTPMNNLFDNVTFSEATSGDSEYRCLVLYANGGNYSDVSVYMSTETSSADTQVDMAREGKNPASPTTIADEDTAPNTIGWDETSFVHRNSASKMPVGVISNGDKIYIWFKRIVSALAGSTSSDSGVISVEFIQTS